MAKIRVVTDSTADMDSALAERMGISVVPLNVHWAGNTYMDKVEITTEEFYRKLREEKGTPKTSQPSAGQFEELYRELLRDADGIVSVHLSSKLSGTLNSAQIAAATLGSDKVLLIDSLNTSYALGLLTTRLAGAAQQGASLEECDSLARDLVPRLRLYAAVDTLEFLRRGGRIGRAQAFAGSLLSVKLIFHLADGEVHPVDRVRTRTALIKRTAEVVGDLGPIEEGALLYGDDPEPAEELRALVMGSFPGVALSTGRIGPVLGTHTGPGVFGFSAIVAKNK